MISSVAQNVLERGSLDSLSQQALQIGLGTTVALTSTNS